MVSRRRLVVSVVYFVIFSNLVGGAFSIIMSVMASGIEPLNGLFLMLGLLAAAGGVILLAGVVKRNARFILVYLILAIMVISFTTVLISVLIIPKAKELRVHVFVVVYVVLIVWWPILYCVYLFYKDLMWGGFEAVPVYSGGEVGGGGGGVKSDCQGEGTSQTGSG